MTDLEEYDIWRVAARSAIGIVGGALLGFGLWQVAGPLALIFGSLIGGLLFTHLSRLLLGDPPHAK